MIVVNCELVNREMILMVFGSIFATIVLSYVAVKIYFPWLILDFRYLAAILSPMVKYLSLMRKKQFLIDVFEERVTETPGKVFVVYEDKKYTYKVQITNCLFQ